MRRAAAAIAGAIATAALVLPADAGPAAGVRSTTDPFAALVGDQRGRKEAGRHSSVERFAVSSDDRAFLLDGRTGVARIKFLCIDADPRLECWLDPEGPAPEIHVVNATRGSRGDTLFKTAEGEVLLRIASHGGATVFWPDDPQGRAAAQSFSEVEALTLPPASRGDAERRAEAASAALASESGVRMRFDIGALQTITIAATDLHPESFLGRDEALRAAPAPAAETSFADAAEGDLQGMASHSAAPDATVLADAIIRAASGIEQVADDPTGARVLKERLTTARFLPGSTKRLSIDGKSLVVVYDPAGGVDGRASAAAVARFLEENL